MHHFKIISLDFRRHIKIIISLAILGMQLSILWTWALIFSEWVPVIAKADLEAMRSIASQTLFRAQSTVFCRKTWLSMTVGQKEDRNHSLQNCDVIGQADKLYKP